MYIIQRLIFRKYLMLKVSALKNENITNNINIRLASKNIT